MPSGVSIKSRDPMSPPSVLKPSRKRHATSALTHEASTAQHSRRSAGSSSSSNVPSVTLLSLERLPSYSSARSYLLSELEQNAREILSLEDWAHSEDRERDYSYFVLYLQWHSGFSAEEFLESVLLRHVDKLQEMTEYADTLASTCDGAKASENVKDRPAPPPSTDENDVLNRRWNLYIVVDRFEAPPSPGRSAEHDADHEDPTNEPSDDDFDEALFLFQWHQEDLARSLAKQVATHDRLRSLVQGITVAVSNQERAAPGLDACTQVLLVGSDDRYRHSNMSDNRMTPGMSDRRSQIPTSGPMDHHVSFPTSESRSLVSIVVTRFDALHGWHPTVPPLSKGSPAAATPSPDSLAVPLDQFRVIAEWNGDGHLPSFGQRAHAQWRLRRGLWRQPLCVGPARQPVPRRPLVSRANPTPPRRPLVPRSSERVPKGSHPALVRRRVQDIAYDVWVVLVMGVYVWFHFVGDVRGLYAGVMSSMVEMVQYLRAL